MTAPEMDTPRTGFPRPRPPRRVLGIILGLVAGLVLGAGGVGLAWALSADDAEGVTADAQAVCGIIERTEDPPSPEDFTVAEANRWGGVAALAYSIGEAGGLYQPLSEALTKVEEAVQNFDLPELRKAVARVRELCADI